MVRERARTGPTHASAAPAHGHQTEEPRRPVKKVVLAYTGGLDTSVACAWLREHDGVDVVTLSVDVGGGSIRDGVADAALAAGASKAYVVDGRDRFVRDFVFPSLQANARYQGVYPMATALARPLIAQLLVEVAERERADAVAHGCTGKGNDQVRFDVAVRALDPKLEVIAPRRVGMGLSPDQEVTFARERGISVAGGDGSGYSIDQNLWGRSIETGVLEDPWQTPPADVYTWTVAPGASPAIPTEVIIGFSRGLPVSIDGEPVEPVELVDRLNTLGGRHGVGRIDHIEDRLVGIKSREIYEAPAAVILHTAHVALEGLTLSKEQLRFNRLVSDELAQATYDGIWFSALHRDLREYVASAQRVVNGEVRLRLDHGTVSIVGRRSDDSLYDRALATYDADDAFDHAAAVGFIRIFGLPLRTEAARHGSAWSWTRPLLSEMPVTLTDASS
ncbi:MAG: argininosuccinate synthase [Chloroflexi bacterium]|nr:argininosuccinate synthase [Chloroflexota bacterium]